VTAWVTSRISSTKCRSRKPRGTAPTCAPASGLGSSPSSPRESTRPRTVAPAPTLPVEQLPTPEQPVEPAPEQPPVAVIQAPAQAEVGQGVKFDAGASQSSTRIVSYAWEFGDGEGANAVSVRHTYRSPGVYNVILTVTDANTLSGSSNFQINIVESSIERPTEEPPIEDLPTEEPPPEELPTEEPPSIQPLPEETPAEGSQ